MYKVKILVLASFAAFALSAIASNSAEAGWLVLGSSLAGTSAIALSTVVQRPGVVQYGLVTIECKGLNIEKGEIQKPDLLLANSLEFTSCTVIAPTTCTLPNQPNAVIGTVPLEGLVTLDGPLAARATGKPKVGSVFATFRFTGTHCPFTGIQIVSGTATLLAPDGKIERLAHTLNIQAEEGELTVESVNVSVLGSALVKLANDTPWSFD